MVIRFLCTCLFLACFSGCIIPTHFGDDEPFQEEEIGFLEIGATSKQEVKDSIGEPIKSFLQGQWWVYRAHQKMSEWAVLVSVGTGGGAWDIGGQIRQYDLLINFNDGDVVNHFVVLTPGSSCIPEFGVCYSEGFFTFLDSPSKESAIQSSQCVIHLFVSNNVDEFRPLWIEVDDFEPATAFIEHDRDYILIDLASGHHEIELSIDFLTRVFSENINLDCKNLDKHSYIAVQFEGSDKASATLVSSLKGRQQVAGRHAHLLADRGFK